MSGSDVLHDVQRDDLIASARAARGTAERVVAGRGVAIAIEIALFDRDQALVGRAPFKSV